jgi:hypothetical protein
MSKTNTKVRMTEREKNKLKVPLKVNFDTEETNRILAENSAETEKDMEIKMLKEEIMRIKIKADQDSSMMMNVQSLVVMKKEMYQAEDFLKSIMKDELSNYMEVVVPVSQEKDKVKVKTESMTNRRSSIEPSMSLKDVNKNCNCYLCIMQSTSKTAYRDFNVDNRISGKEFLITKSIYMKIHFNNREFDFMNDNRVDNKKEIKMISSRSDNMNIRLELYSKRANDKTFEKPEYNFSENKLMQMQLITMNMSAAASFSAMMVVRAMRQLHSANMVPIMELDGLKSEEKGDCFRKLMEQIFNYTFSSRKMNSISDLTEEEEIVFLSSTADHDVYLFLNNGDPNSSLNHVSLDYFEGSTKTKLYMLVTPLFRSTNFYSTKSEDWEELESNIKEIEKKKKNEERMEKMIKISDKVMREEKLKASKEEVEKLREVLKEKEEKLNKENVESFSISQIGDREILSTDKSILNNISIGKPYYNRRMSMKEEEFQFVKNNMFPLGISAFVEKRIKDKSANEPVDEALWRNVLRSQMSYLYFLNDSTTPNLLVMSSVTMREFKALLFFSKDFKEFSNLITADKLTAIKQMLTILPKIYYEKCFDQFKDKLIMNSFEWIYKDFLVSMDNFTTFDTRSIEKLYMLFKLRIMSNLYLWQTMKDDQENINSEWTDIRYNMVLHGADKEANEQKMLMDKYINLRAEVHREESKDITKWQPKTSTQVFFRNNDLHHHRFNDSSKFYNEDAETELLELKLRLENL